MICRRCGKEGHFARGCAAGRQGNSAALDAMGQAEEGYNIVTHENELLCDFTHAHASHIVNESMNECTWNKLVKHTIKPLSKWDGCQLVGVEGSPIPVVGVADVEFRRECSG